MLQRIYLAYALLINVGCTNGLLEKKTFVASFQTDIKGHPWASTDVWLKIPNEIPKSKEFTVCHWIKIKFYNVDNAGCLWSYCTVPNKGQKMECLQVCMPCNKHPANLELLF